jgi:uncharacterized protein (TIGR02145 family)
MFHTKVLLAVLTGISLCMANISGVVTDSAGVKIAGAIVQLEQGGQTDTTDSDGSFILTAGTAGISSHFKTLPGKLFATIQNGLLYVQIAEKTSLQITTFSLTGKVLSDVWQLMDAGIHYVRLPYRSAGIYLYKIKAGNNEVVLKCNSISGLFSGSTELFQGASSNIPLSKRAKVTTVINDVIAITKNGYLNYHVVIYNSDTTGIAIKLIASAGTVTDIDGNAYQTVKIGNQVWTVVNLRVTKYNDGSLIPLGTSTTNWYDDTTPKFCFYENTTNTESIKKYGALYNWHVLSPANPKKIAPTGWHVPSNAEWDTLQNYLIAKGYNWDGTITDDKIAKSMASKTDWKTETYPISGPIGKNLASNNSSGFSALPGGCIFDVGYFSRQKTSGYWWSTTEESSSYALYRALGYDSGALGKGGYYDKSCGFSVRVVKD